MDGPRSRTDHGAPRPDLPIWERTPRAVPPPLGPPPPVEVKRLAGIGAAVANARADQISGTVASGVRVNQSSRAAVGAVPNALSGVEPRDAANRRSIAAAPARSWTTPVAHPPKRQLPLGRAAAGVAVAVVAIAATAVAMRSGTGVQPSAHLAITPPVSSPPRVPSTHSSPNTPAPASSPVAQALANLSDQPMVRYSGLSPDGRASWQLTVATGGEVQGTLDLGDGKLAVLEIGGRTYFQAADTASAVLLAKLPSGMTAASVRGKWVTGEGALQALLPSGLASAENLAASLQSALPSQDVGFPSPTAPSTRIDDDPATPVDTSAGTLYISTTQPYRVLRLVPPTTDSGQPTEIDTVSQPSANTLFDNLVDQTKSLTGALDFGIAFDYNPDPRLYCTQSQCTVEVDGLLASAADPNANPTGSVVADVTAKVRMNGQSAGQCEAIVKMPLGRAGKLTCQDPDAVPLVQPLSFSVNLGFVARANTQSDVDALVSALLLDRGGAAHTELG